MSPHFTLAIKSPLLLFEFLNTSLKARKKTQYNIAINVRIPITNTLLKIHKAIENTIAITIHNRMLRIIPAIPSPTSMGPDEAKFEEIFEVSKKSDVSVNVCEGCAFGRKRTFRYLLSNKNLKAYYDWYDKSGWKNFR